MSEPSPEPRSARSDLTKLRIDRREEAPRSAGALVLVFLLGAAAGAGGGWYGAQEMARRTGAATPAGGGAAATAGEARPPGGGTATAGSEAAASTARVQPRAPADLAGSGSAASSATTSATATATGGEADAPALDAPILSASGYVIARREAEVGAKVPGRLAWLGIEAGSTVKENEVIARLEDADVQAELSLARASLERAAARVKRLKDSLIASSADEIDAAEMEARVGKARVDLGEARVADTVIRSPFAGRVVEKRAEVGETVSPLATSGQLTPTGIARIVDFSTLECEIEVNERYVKKLTEGQPALAEVTAFPGKKWRAELRQIIPVASREKAVVEVRVSLLERDAGFVPGMGVKVTFFERAGR